MCFLSTSGCVLFKFLKGLLSGFCLQCLVLNYCELGDILINEVTLLVLDLKISSRLILS